MGYELYKRICKYFCQKNISLLTNLLVPYFMLLAIDDRLYDTSSSHNHIMYLMIDLLSPPHITGTCIYSDKNE